MNILKRNEFETAILSVLFDKKFTVLIYGVTLDLSLLLQLSHLLADLRPGLGQHEVDENVVLAHAASHHGIVQGIPGGVWLPVPNL